jgi:hypothetical protein
VGGIKENEGGGEFSYYIVRTFINATMNPQYNIIKQEIKF